MISGKVHKMLKSYGQWMHYSVFECPDLTDTRYAKLRTRLDRLIDPQKDGVRFYFLCACCQNEVEQVGGEAVGDDTIFFA
jgi:CRISPR-associated protein Cas2